MTTISPALHRAPATPGRLTFPGTIRSELLKLASLRSIRWLAVTVVALGALGALMFAGDTRSTSSSAILGASSLAGVGVALLAGLAVAGEYATGSARTTLTVVPRRPLVLGAKTVAIAAVGAALGLAATTAGLGVGAAMHDGDPDFLRDDVVLRASGAVVYITLMGLIGLFSGVVLRGVAATTIAVIGVLFIASPMLGGVRVGDGWLTDFLVSESGPGLVVGTDDWSLPLAVTALWVLVPAAVAAYRLFRQDA